MSEDLIHAAAQLRVAHHVMTTLGSDSKEFHEVIAIMNEHLTKAFNSKLMTFILMPGQVTEPVVMRSNVVEFPKQVH